jgi:hypothetical protein
MMTCCSKRRWYRKGRGFEMMKGRGHELRARSPSVALGLPTSAPA